MKPQLLDRLLLPILIPVGILALIAVMLYSMSRILLAMPGDAATPVAMSVATFILLLSAYMATQPVTRRQVIGIASMLGALLIAGGVWGEMEYDGKAEGHGGGELAANLVKVVAENTAFNTKEIVLHPGEVTIEFENRDTVPHNVAIYKTKDAKDAKDADKIFVGEIFKGVATKEYKFTAPPKGEYYFQCDVHPQMNGAVKVEESGGASGGATSGALDVSAKNLAFNTKELKLPAEKDVTIRFKNEDTAPHNVAIYKSADAKEPLLEGKIIPGGSAIDYKFKTPAAGQYYFQCDVHPSMSGVVKIE